jgi:two-component system, LytTR family, response regulator
MLTIKCLIIEDEPLAARMLLEYIKKLPYLVNVGVCKDAIYASEYLMSNEVDLIFLDLHLPTIKGLDYLKILKSPPEIIITTAYHQYALESYELNVTDYLLKPFSFNRFLLAIEKVAKKIELNKSVVGKNAPDATHIFVTVNRKKVKINFTSILYLESIREYINIYTSKGTYLTKMTSTEIETLLPKPGFVRVHRSFIVSIDKVEAFSKEELEIQGKTIPIALGHKDHFLKMMQ